MTSMPLYQQITIIAICAVVTIATRVVPFLIFKPDKPLPPYMEYLGKVLPGAVFGMIVVYCLRNTPVCKYPYGIPEIIGIAVTVAVHLYKKNMMISMVAGTIVYMISVQVIFI